MGKKRKQRLCHICKKRPIWIGGDVKNPGPVCKRCYHERVWPERLKRGGRQSKVRPHPKTRRWRRSWARIYGCREANGGSRP